MLFHVSEDAGISRFEPRPSEYTDAPVVWAIDDERLRNYLLPRDCPRVTCFLGPKTTDDDRRRFLGAARALVAIEESWLERVRGCVLYCYHLPSDTFAIQDHTAGYYVSRQPIVPTGVTRIDSVLDELTRRGVDVRVLPSLWALRDAVIASTLEFSIIRMRETTSRHVPANLQGRADPSQPSVRNATAGDEVSLLRLDSVAQRDPARVQFIEHSVRLPECLIADMPAEWLVTASWSTPRSDALSLRSARSCRRTPSSEPYTFTRTGDDAASEGGLLSPLEQLAVGHGLDHLQRVSSLNAEAFYRYSGYEVAERGTHRLGSGHEMAGVRMRKPLNRGAAADV